MHSDLSQLCAVCVYWVVAHDGYMMIVIKAHNPQNWVFAGKGQLNCAAGVLAIVNRRAHGYDG